MSLSDCLSVFFCLFVSFSSSHFLCVCLSSFPLIYFKALEGIDDEDDDDELYDDEDDEDDEDEIDDDDDDDEGEDGKF